jgi:hypothetical protein
VAFPQRASPGYCLASRSSPLFEFRLPLESCPDKPSRSTAVNQLLSWALVPYSTCRTRGPPDAGLPARYVPPSGFGYPPGGLLPLDPCRFSFTPAALLGFTLRRFLLPEGIRSVTIRKGPHTVSPAGAPVAEAPSRPNRPRFLGCAPPESPWRSYGGLARGSLVPPLGFTLLGFSDGSLGRTLARPPLTRFVKLAIARPADRRPRVSIGFRRAPSVRRTRYVERTGQPF